MWRGVVWCGVVWCGAVSWGWGSKAKVVPGRRRCERGRQGAGGPALPSKNGARPYIPRALHPGRGAPRAACLEPVPGRTQCLHFPAYCVKASCEACAHMGCATKHREASCAGRECHRSSQAGPQCADTAHGSRSAVQRHRGLRRNRRRRLRHPQP